MKLFLLLIFLPLVAIAQPTFGPYPVPGSGGGGPTNGQTAAQVGSAILATNTADIIPRIQTSANTASNSVYTNLPPRTNYVAFTNAATAGQALVLLGTDAYGSPLAKGTNWPSSSGGGISALYATNAIIYDTNTINGQAFRVDTNGVMHISTNGVDVVSVGTNGMAIASGSSNWFGTTVTVQGGLGTTRSNLLAPTALSFPATTVNWTNPINTSIIVSIDNSAVTGTAIKKNGTTIFSSITGDASVGLQPGEYFSQTYTIGTPTATWYPFP